MATRTRRALVAWTTKAGYMKPMILVVGIPKCFVWEGWVSDKGAT